MLGTTMGQMIRGAREEQGLSVAEMAARMKVAEDWLRDLEGDRREAPPAPQLLNRLAQLLRLSIAELLMAAGYELELEEPDAASRYRIIRESPPAELFGVRYLIDEASAEILEGVAMQMSMLGSAREVGIKTIKYTEVQ